MVQITAKQYRQHRQIQLLILASFLITFFIARVITYLQLRGILPLQQHNPYIHHLVPGIFLLITSGYAGIAYWYKPKLRAYMAALFGIGAALTIDEFALWIYLSDLYWARQGRYSIDAAIILAGIFFILYLWSALHQHKWIEE